MLRYTGRKRTNESPQPFPMTAEEAKVFDHAIAGGMWEPNWISRPILAEMVQNERKNRAAEVMQQAAAKKASFVGKYD